MKRLNCENRTFCEECPSKCNPKSCLDFVPIEGTEDYHNHQKTDDYDYNNVLHNELLQELGLR